MKNEPLPPQMTALVALADLRPSPTNPRKTFDGIEELAASIRSHGVLQNILVRPVGNVSFNKKTGQYQCDVFEIVAGNRRYLAMLAAGMTEAPVTVRDLTDEQVLEIQLIENDQREDVKPTEQAAAYKRLVDAVGLAESAKRIGKSESTVRGIVQLAKAPPALAQAVDAGIVSRSVAEVVCRVPGDRDRVRVAACVLLDELNPKSLSRHGGDGDDWMDEANAVAGGSRPGERCLTHRETKELIGRHFTRELKTAPFSRKTVYQLPQCEPGHERTMHDCDACPKRAGNDPAAKAEGVRADVCLDPECFEEKVEAHRLVETRKFAKKHFGDESYPVGTVEWSIRDRPPSGYCDLAGLIISSELGDAGWSAKKRDGETVAEVLDSVPAVGPSVPKILAFDAKGKPHAIVRTADLRRRLIAAGVIAKPTPAPKATTPTVSANGKPVSAPTADGPYLLYRLKLNPDVMPTVEFDAVENALTETLFEQAASAFMDWFDGVDWTDFLEQKPFVDYERVPDAAPEANDVKPSPPTAKPFGYDDLIRRCLRIQSGAEQTWEAMIERGATDAEIKATLGEIWGLGGGGSTGGGSDYRYKGGKQPSLECTVGDDDEGPLKLKGISLIDRVRDVLGIPRPEAQTSAPAPGPIVCAPVGSGKLADIDGITAEDAACLHAVGIITLTGLELKLNDLRAERGRQNATIYDVLRTYGGAFTPGDAERIGDAIMDHLNVAKAVGASVDAEPKAKGKRRKAGAA